MCADPSGVHYGSMLSISRTTGLRGPIVAGWLAAASVSLAHDPEAAPTRRGYARR
jgi:hypothetical protein